MKRKITLIVSVITVLVTCMGLLVSCFWGGGNNDKDEPKTYTIMYTDDAGKHEITVTDGMPYTLESVPYKKGYVFLGLYDAEVGGTQYVTASGASVSPFTDKKNMVLFPRFNAQTYKVILDYQGAAVTGSRELNVSYGASLPELPKDLVLDNKIFSGWYTAVNCGGTQIADKYSLIPVVSVVNDTNFDLSGDYIYLYAGFETKKITVTCCYEAGMPTEEIKVDYGTPISSFVSETRVNGEAVLYWSKSQDGAVFNSNITEDTVLYAVEYAPVIELDTNGGDYAVPVVARAGSTVVLPIPTKALAKFLYWEDMNGNKYTSSTMPSKSIALKAIWQAKIVFDENGGSDVLDISESAGDRITLPTPTKLDYVFAGWYTSDKKEYTSTVMPTSGIALKAGWYKQKEDIVTICSGDKKLGRYDNTDIKMQNELTIDLSNILSESFNGYIDIVAHIKLSHSEGSLSEPKGYSMYFYSQSTVSNSFLIYSKDFTLTSSKFVNYSFNFSTKLNGNKIYVANKSSTYWSNAYVSDYYLNVTYPDTTYLYL